MIAAPPQPAPARVQVVAREFRFQLSRTHVRAGEVIIELVNAGEDAHDLRLRRVGTKQTIRFPVVQAGGHVDRDVHLSAGRYVLWCSLPDHRELGMHAVLVVRRRS